MRSRSWPRVAFRGRSTRCCSHSNRESAEQVLKLRDETLSTIFYRSSPGNLRPPYKPYHVLFKDAISYSNNKRIHFLFGDPAHCPRHIPGRHQENNIKTDCKETGYGPWQLSHLILLCDTVTIDGVWIGNRIYRTRDYILQITIIHKLVFSVMVFTALLATVDDPLLPGSRPCRLSLLASRFWLSADMP
jgi:hypothetical protein